MVLGFVLGMDHNPCKTLDTLAVLYKLPLSFSSVDLGGIISPSELASTSQLVALHSNVLDTKTFLA